jgi:general secretion pathway protein A
VKSEMFVEYYGLREDPFTGTTIPRYPYLSTTHREALGALCYGLERRLGFPLLVGERGIGKTTILRQLQSRLGDDARTLFLSAGRYDASGFLHCLLTHLGIDSSDPDVASMQAQINRILRREATTHRRSLLIVDDGQNLDNSALNALHSLSNLKTSDGKPLEIVLSGSPEIAETLMHSDFARFRQCVRIDRLTPLEVAEYINHRVRLAGSADGLIFESDACAAIAKHSKGVPANINSLCSGALQTGSERNVKRINLALVESVIARDQLLLGSIIVERPQLLHTPRIVPWVAWCVILFLTILVGANLWYHEERRTHRTVDPIVAVAVPLSKHAHGADDQSRFAERSRNSQPSVATSMKLHTTSAATPSPTSKPELSADRQSKTREESTSNRSAAARSTAVRTNEAAPPSRALGTATARASDEQVSVKIGAADAHMRLGEYDSAIAVLRRALILVPNNPEIERRIKRARRAKIAEEKTLQR